MKHLTPFFGGRKMASITTPDVRNYIAARQAETMIVRGAYDMKRKDGSVVRVPEQQRSIDGVSNAEINRELTLLKRMFTLAVQAGKLLHRPHIPVLREDNTRTGFFEPDQFTSVLTHLPESLRPVVEFAYITGWRIQSEILPLQWRQIDFSAAEIRLDAGTTKNREGRVFPMTDDLRALLQVQHAEHLRLKRIGKICPSVFFRLVAEKRGGTEAPETYPRVYEGVEGRLRRRRLPWSHPARSAPNGRSHDGAAWRPGTRRHEAHRPQDAIDLRAVQHRERWRPAKRRCAVDWAD